MPYTNPYATATPIDQFGNPLYGLPPRYPRMEPGGIDDARANFHRQFDNNIGAQPQPYVPPIGYAAAPGPDNPAYHTLAAGYQTAQNMAGINAGFVRSTPVQQPAVNSVASDYARYRPMYSNYTSVMSPQQIDYVTQGTTQSPGAVSALQSYQAHTRAMAGNRPGYGFGAMSGAGGGLPQERLGTDMGNLDQRFVLPEKYQPPEYVSYQNWAQTHPTGSSGITARESAAYQKWKQANAGRVDSMQDFAQQNRVPVLPVEQRQAMVVARAQQQAARRKSPVGMTAAQARYQTMLPQDYPSYAAAFGVPGGYNQFGPYATPYPAPPQPVVFQPSVDVFDDNGQLRDDGPAYRPRYNPS